MVTELPILVDPERDRVKVDDESVQIGDAGCGPAAVLPDEQAQARTAQRAQGRAGAGGGSDADWRAGPGVSSWPAGRRVHRLLLLTNDGELTNQLTHPRYGVPKVYRAIVIGRVTDQSLQELEKGVWLADKHGKGFKTGNMRIKVVRRIRDKGGDRSILEMGLREGRNRQVRRMLAAIGHKVKELTRIKLGPLTLDRLPEGSVRELSPREVRELRIPRSQATRQTREGSTGQSASRHAPARRTRVRKHQGNPIVSSASERALKSRKPVFSGRSPSKGRSSR